MQIFLALLALIPLPLLAAMDEGMAQAPSETVSMVYVVIFGIIFVGMIVGFLLYLWWNEKHKKPD